MLFSAESGMIIAHMKSEEKNVWELKNIEEPELIDRLGDEYADYRRNTPMFIPSYKSKSK